MTLMKAMPDGCVDMGFADPPYNVGVNRGPWYKAMTEEAYRDWVAEWFDHLRRVCRGNVIIMPSVAHHRLYPEPAWELCWFKGGGASYTPVGFSCWEPVLFYGELTRALTLSGRDGWHFTVGPREADSSHPCPKPLSIVGAIVERFSKPGDVVIDPFLGSGTTAVAAERFGRSFVGAEIDPDFAAEAEKRIAREREKLRLPLEAADVATAKTPPGPAKEGLFAKAGGNQCGRSDD